MIVSFHQAAPVARSLAMYRDILTGPSVLRNLKISMYPTNALRNLTIVHIPRTFVYCIVFVVVKFL